MKKKIIVLLTLVLSLTACGGEDSQSQTSDQAQNSVVESSESQSSREESPEASQEESEASEETESGPSEEDIEYKLTIDASSLLDPSAQVDETILENIPESGYILEESAITVEEPMTAFQALEQACKENGINLTYSGEDEMLFVTEINGIGGGLAGEYSGWMYRVNGEEASVGMGVYELEPGDVLEVYYSASF